MKPYEPFDHTADVGLYLYGKDYGELLVNGAKGFYALMTDAVSEAVQVRQSIRLEAENAGELLLKWLRELLFYFSAKKWIFMDFHFEKISETALEVSASGFVFDPSKFDQKVEVKAVTYHGFEINKNGEGWKAIVIFDI